MRRRRALRFTLLMAAGMAAGVVVPVSAQEAAPGGVDLDPFVPALDSDGFIGIQSSRTPGPGRFSVGAGMRHGWRLLDLDDGGQARVTQRAMSDVWFQLGLGGRAALAAVLPVAWYQSGFTETAAGDRIDVPAQGLGDAWLLGRYRLLGDATDAAGNRRDGPGLALQAGMALPVGARRAFLGEPGVRSDLQLIADFHLFGAAIAATVGWLHRFRPQSLLDVPFRDAISFGVALKVPVIGVHGLEAMAELRGRSDAGDVFGAWATTPVEGNLGLRYAFGDLALTALFGGGFTRAHGQPALRSGLYLSWAPRVRDQDGDGIPDASDECPMLPEDFDGFEDADGCPDPDNDNDMIPDEDDRCPNEPALEGYDLDEDGCTDPGAPLPEATIPRAFPLGGPGGGSRAKIMAGYPRRVRRVPDDIADTTAVERTLHG